MYKFTFYESVVYHNRGKHNGRKIYNELLKWRNDTNKFRLIVDGLKQIGKSYIVEKFAYENYENVIVNDFRNRVRILGYSIAEMKASRKI